MIDARCKSNVHAKNRLFTVNVQPSTGRTSRDDVLRRVHSVSGCDGRHALGIGVLARELPARRLEHLNLPSHGSDDDAIASRGPHRAEGKDPPASLVVVLDLEARFGVVVHRTGVSTRLGAPHADEIVVAGGQQLTRSVWREVRRLARRVPADSAAWRPCRTCEHSPPVDRHTGKHHALSAGFECTVDLLLVELHRR